MDSSIINHIVETALSVIFGIFIINLFCNAFLGIDLIETVQKLIAKWTGKANDD